MISQSNQSINGIYLFNPYLTQQQLNDAFAEYLSKAEALAIMAATTDFEAYTSEVIDNYLWTLSDLIREAKWLYEKANSLA